MTSTPPAPPDALELLLEEGKKLIADHNNCLDCQCWLAELRSAILAQQERIAELEKRLGDKEADWMTAMGRVNEMGLKLEAAEKREAEAYRRGQELMREQVFKRFDIDDTEFGWEFDAKAALAAIRALPLEEESDAT